MAFFGVSSKQQYEAAYPTMMQAPDTSALEREKAPAWYEGVGAGAVAGLKSAYWRDMFNVADSTGEVDLRQKALDNLEALKPDPNTMGVAGQMLYSMADQLGAVYAAASGGNVTPQLMAMESGKSYAKSQKALHMREGIDERTAGEMAVTEGAGVGLGVMLPTSLGGSTLLKMASGAGIMGTFGAGQRYLISDVLKKGGYDDMARQYEPLQTQAIMTDLVMGAVFGGGPAMLKGAVGLAKGKARAEPLEIPKPMPSEVDAALTARQQLHMEIDAAPGIPTNTRTRNAHVAAMDEATTALAMGREVNVAEIMRGTEFSEKTLPEGLDVEAIVRSELERVGAHDVLADLRAVEAEAQARGLAVEGDGLPVVPEPKAMPEVRIVEKDNGWIQAETDHGTVGGTVKDGVLRITHAELAEAERGKGQGVAMYRRLIDEAHARGLKVSSDVTVEMPAVRVYQALERRGYAVTRRKGGGELASDESAPEGAYFGPNAKEPAFDVGPRKTSAGGDAKLAPPEVEKPSMEIPDSSGSMVKATDAVAAAQHEVEQANTLAKGFDVAADCALRFGA